MNDPAFGVIGSRIGGSIGKGTAIAPTSDVDLYLYLDSRFWETRGKPLAPSTVISRLHARLKTRLAFELGNRHCRLRPQTHSVGIHFQKEGSIGIDVVPALTQDENVEDAWIPRRTSGIYVQTSIERQLRLIESMDSPFRFLRRGIRLLKVWNQQDDVRLPSYAVEILGLHAVHRGCKKTEAGVFLSALDFIGETAMREPVYVDRYFGYAPPARRTCVILDPAMPSNNLGEGMDAQDGDRLGTAARRALAKIRKAVEFSEARRGRVAAQCLSEAFGQEELFKGGL
ncbi:MAG: nucleotidyltransferase [Pseudomonadota bacterium]|nr:nucleotidyltransferase [Pseudomonadota bacterium]